MCSRKNSETFRIIFRPLGLDCRVLACLVFSSLLIAADSRAETEVISIKYRMAAEVLPIVKGMLSGKGTVTADIRTNSLVITDTEDRLGHVRAFLSVHDKPIRQVTIRVRFDTDSSSTHRGISAGGRISGEHGTIGKGMHQQNGMYVRGRYNKHNSNRDADYYVVAASGSSAYIRVGTNIPWNRKWMAYGPGHGRLSGTMEYQNVETGMEVLPVVMGDRVSLSITPRLSYLDTTGETTIVRCTEAATQLSLPFGIWTKIAGANDKTNSVMTAILETVKQTRSDIRSISVMVEDR